MLSLEAKFRCDPILIQVPELKCRDGGPSQRTSHAREMMRLEEPRIVKSLEDTQLVIIVQINIISRKNIQLSGGQIVLQLIQNLKS